MRHRIRFDIFQDSESLCFTCLEGAPELKMRLLRGAVTAGVLITYCAVSQAASIQFAQFSQSTGANGFKWTGSSGAAKGTLGTVAANIPIKFKFQDFVGGAIVPGLLLNMDYNAVLTISAASASPAVNAVGNVSESLQSLTFSIKAVGAQPGVTNGELLLGGTSLAGNGLISGPNGSVVSPSRGASLSFGDILDSLVFTSSAIILPDSDEDGAGFGFSNVKKSSGTDTGFTFNNNATVSPLDDFINSFTAAGTGTFSTSEVVPEPGSIALFCGMLAGGGLFVVRRRRIS